MESFFSELPVAVLLLMTEPNNGLSTMIKMEYIRLERGPSTRWTPHSHLEQSTIQSDTMNLSRRGNIIWLSTILRLPHASVSWRPTHGSGKALTGSRHIMREGSQRTPNSQLLIKICTTHTRVMVRIPGDYIIQSWKCPPQVDWRGVQGTFLVSLETAIVKIQSH